VLLDRILGVSADNRPYVYGKPAGTTGLKLVERSAKHRQQAVGNILLQAKHA
jgi:hypothetical protein